MPIERFKPLDKPEETLSMWARQLNYIFNNLDQTNIATTTLSLGPNQVKASNIDFGVGADQVDAGDIPITDAGTYYVGGTVELALQEAGRVISSTGGNTKIYSSNYVTVDCKNLILSSGVWDDARVPITATKAAGVNDPTFAKFRDSGGGSVGVYAYDFSAVTKQELFFALQLPHTYKEGTDIYPHVHWSPPTTESGNVVWGIEYSWVNEYNAFPNTASTTVTSAANSTAYAHRRAEFGAINGAGKIRSSMLMGRIYRDSTNTADTYSTGAFLLEIDFHHQVNKLGTETYDST